MEASTLLEVLRQAIAESAWATIYPYGCSTFTVRPTSAEAQMDAIVIEGRLAAQRFEQDPPTAKDLQTGETMRQRLKTPSEQNVTLYLDPQDIKAVLVYKK